MARKVNSYVVATLYFVAVVLFVITLAFCIRLYDNNKRVKYIEELHSEIK